MFLDFYFTDVLSNYLTFLDFSFILIVKLSNVLYTTNKDVTTQLKDIIFPIDKHNQSVSIHF